LLFSFISFLLFVLGEGDPPGIVTIASERGREILSLECHRDNADVI
jgi:hypothetical protein